ncbi:hypothetical protein DSM110093_03873 (plasmid) [Sulfitobacter sp. DSM 110093]|nr:hypothetical protein DSM110093_03612 [Sulfitobacter sp. DSM 110093]UOA34038.1 hypothetical protein DSM110093_03873 [Sulfitobacter sp. DSM 110093]
MRLCTATPSDVGGVLNFEPFRGQLFFQRYFAIRDENELPDTRIDRLNVEA